MRRNTGALSRSSRTAPVNRVGNTDGILEDSVHDYLLPLMQWYETWGRDIEIRFVTSTGDDESAQHADAVTVTAEKPFAVINLVTSGLDVFDTEIGAGEDPRVGLGDHHGEGVGAGPVPLGAQ